MEALHLVILGSLAVMTLVLVVNLTGFSTLRSGNRPEHCPRVSILVPARNEAETLDRCLSGLAGQEYPDLEIVVLDDRSTDDTAAIARGWAARDDRMRVVSGAELPDGWVGKAHACHQLAAQATGTLLLFADADTEFAPGAVTAAVAAREQTGAGLLSLIPHQIMVTFWERTFLPLLHFSTMCFLPFPLVTRARSPLLAMANGQFMLFDRRVYEAIGGHAAVHTAIVEDVWLARAVKRHGHRLVVMDGGELVSCRMYRSLGHIWEGFSKNLFAGFRFSLPAIGAVMAFVAVAALVPFLLLPVALLSGAPWPLVLLPLVEVALLLAIRAILAVRFRMSFPEIFLHPLALILLLAIAINSCRWVIAGGGARWKGRRYDFRSHAFGRS